MSLEIAIRGTGNVLEFCSQISVGTLNPVVIAAEGVDSRGTGYLDGLKINDTQSNLHLECSNRKFLWEIRFTRVSYELPVCH